MKSEKSDRVVGTWGKGGGVVSFSSCTGSSQFDNLSGSKIGAQYSR